MGSLLLNFFKRAVLVPAIVCGCFLLIVSFVISPAVEKSEQLRNSVKPQKIVNLSQFSAGEFQDFSQLQPEDYICTVTADTLPLEETVVLFNSESWDAAWMMPGSTEPWNHGCVMLRGWNTKTEWKGLYGAKKGDVLTLKFLTNGEYRYTIQKIIPYQREETIANYAHKDTLLIALPYNDFFDLGHRQFFVVYVAHLGDK